MGLDMYLYRMTKNQKKRMDENGRAYDAFNEKWEAITKDFPKEKNGWQYDESRMTDEQKKLREESRAEYRAIHEESEKIDDEIRKHYGVDREYGAYSGYWRKFNALHGYICDTFADGVDECQVIPLTKANLKKILSVLKKTKKILDKHFEKDEKGAYSFTGNVKDIPLQPRGGFFFGGTEIDEWYQDDVDESVKFFSNLVDTFDSRNEVCYYQASW